MKRGKVVNNVRIQRRKLDLTQQELANQVGVHRQTIIAIEKQKYEPTIGIVLALSTVLNEPVENIFYYQKEQQN